LQNQDPPAHVTIASQADAESCLRAWDWRRHLDKLKMHGQDGYHHWIYDSGLADLELRKWLFGFKGPSDVFILPDELRRLREESSERGICKAAGVQQNLVTYWRARSHLLDALEDLRRRVEDPATSERALDAAFRKSHPNVEKSTLKYMLAYVTQATEAARLERAGLARDRYGELRRQAEAVGALPDLEDYLNRRGEFTPDQSKTCGLRGARQKFFIPSKRMFAFRTYAMKLKEEENIEQLSGLPFFWEWFADWSMPNADGGRASTSPRLRSPRNRTAGDSSIATAKQQRKKRSLEKHLQWKALRDSGQSIGQITDTWNRAHPKDQTTDDAVKKALKRLSNGADHGGGH
jgi:hypothetical protein